MFTVKQKYLLTIAASTLAAASTVMAQSNSSPKPTPPPSTLSPTPTIITGRLVNLRQFMMGQASTDLVTNPVPAPAPVTPDARGLAAATGSTAASSNAGALAGTNSPEKVIARDTGEGVSGPNGSDNVRSGGGVVAGPDQVLALVDASGNLIILGQSWRTAGILAPNSRSHRAAVNTANAVADSTAAQGSSNPGLTGSPEALPNSVPSPAAANNIGGNPTGAPLNNPSGVPPTDGRLYQTRIARAYLDQQVTVTGTIYSRAGLKYMDVGSIDLPATAANAQAGQPSVNAR